MDRTKIHPLILFSLLINAIAMGMFAFENYKENNIGYTVTFIILCLFLIVLTGYGLVRNNKINRISK
ncbi:hypothetical protein [Bacillus sp. B1-b2]|uniref:hypothetical protein n=1 Tax=Bacillus sp. B1-b2 TaxID=2653201 RepID=UPI001261EE9E|nr:hypothetical protein [Bacillus sp. B1-b2]KAB7672078.1 hypothetical protein F9279_03940 [Bacillus sp. B1-b2]